MLTQVTISESLASSKPWRAKVFDGTGCPPTMLSNLELSLLEWLASEYYLGHGAIIDAGCFLGGSSFAFAKGLQQNLSLRDVSSVKIHSYDLFEATGETWNPQLLAKYQLSSGDDFQSAYRKNLQPWLDRIEVHAGDLLKENWGDAPVEILFLDICKTPELHDHAAELWFPKLIPGHSILIQQDFGWSNYAWGNVVMEALSEKFERLDDLPYATRVYRCIAPISIEDVRRNSWKAISNQDKSRFMDRVLKESRGSDIESHMLVNRALVAREVGDEAKLFESLFEVFYHFPTTLAAEAAILLFPEWFSGPRDPLSLEWFADNRMDLVCQMSRDERHYLYATTLALRPQRILEIGRARGGSTLILAEAKKRIPNCRLVSMDPNCIPGYQITPEMEARLQDEAILIHGYSPYENGRAMQEAGGPFDLVFIDGDHTYEPCLRDILGVLPYLSDQAIILLHDAFYPEVADAIAEAVSKEPGLTDCGIVARQSNDGLAHENVRGRPKRYAGIHQLLWAPKSIAERPTVQMKRSSESIYSRCKYRLHSVRRKIKRYLTN